MLTEQQKIAVKMLYYGERVQDTAAAVGVHRSTVWRWTKRKDFRKEWRRINRNYARKNRRMWEKEILERERKRAENIEKCEAKMREEAEKIKETPTESFYKACNEYEKALLGGYSLAQILGKAPLGKPLKPKGRRR